MKKLARKRKPKFISPEEQKRTGLDELGGQGTGSRYFQPEYSKVPPKGSEFAKEDLIPTTIIPMSMVTKIEGVKDFISTKCAIMPPALLTTPFFITPIGNAPMRYCLKCGLESRLFPCPLDQSVLMIRIDNPL